MQAEVGVNMDTDDVQHVISYQDTLIVLGLNSVTDNRSGVCESGEIKKSPFLESNVFIFLISKH